MRALILVLITLNLALAAWSWHYDKLSSHDDISLVPEIPVPSADHYEDSEELDGDAESVEDDVASDKQAGEASTQDSDMAPRVDPAESAQSEENRQALASPVAAATAEEERSSRIEETQSEPEQVAEKPRAAPASLPKEVAPADDAQDVETSSASPEPKPAPDKSVETVASLPVTGCIVYGPFERAVDAAQLVQRLQLDGYSGQFDQKNERVHRGRWVLFPVADTTEAEALIAAFEEAGLKDFGLVRKSPLGMAVSAGLYAGERSLNARLDSLMKAGFTPKVDNLYRDASFYQVTVQEAPANPEKYGKFLACNA